MSALLATVFLGVVVGSIYALSAFGLVLTYRTSGVFNFAHGAIGMFSAYAYFQLTQGGRVGFAFGVYDQRWRLPTLVALVVVIGGLGPLLGWALDRAVFRWLRDTATVVQIVATIGLLIAFQGIAGVMWGAATTLTPRSVFSGRVFTVGAFRASIEQVATVVLVLVLCAGLVAFLRGSALGVRMRAVVDSDDLAELSGVDATRVSAAAWALGTAFASAAGILIVPFFGTLDPVTLTFVVVSAAAAAVVGRLSSFPLTLLGGLGLGAAQLIVQRYATTEVARQLRPAIPFLVLFGVLFLPRWRTRSPARAQPGRTALVRTEPLQTVPAVAALAVILVAAPFVLGPTWQLHLSRLPGVALIFLSLVLLSGFAGQISLAQAALAGFGAFVAAHLASDGLPFVLAAVLGALAVVPLGAFLASRAVRLSPMFLAFATLAFGAVMDEVVFTSKTFGRGLAGVPFDKPAFLASPRVYYLFALAVFAAAAGWVTWFRSSRTGLHLAAMRESEAGLETLGISAARLKFVSFCASAFVAGLGGALLAGADGLATPFNYIKLQSLLMLAIAVIGGIGAWQGALAGAALFQLGQAFVHDMVSGTNVVSNFLATHEISGDRIEALLPVFFGIGAIGLARNPHGIAEQIRGGLRRAGVPIDREPRSPAPGMPPVTPVAPDALVSFSGGRLYHRPDCLLARGKDATVVVDGPDGLAPCPVCEPARS